jgi:hypothetical protein
LIFERAVFILELNELVRAAAMPSDNNIFDATNPISVVVTMAASLLVVFNAPDITPADQTFFTSIGAACILSAFLFYPIKGGVYVMLHAFSSLSRAFTKESIHSENSRSSISQ